MMKSIESFPPPEEVTSKEEATLKEQYKAELEGLKEDQEGVKSARLKLKLKIGEVLMGGLSVALTVNLLAGALGNKAEAAELVKEAQNQQDEKIQIDQQTRPTLEEQLPELDLEGQKVEGGGDDEDKEGIEEVSSSEQIFDNLPEKVTLEFPSTPDYSDAEKEKIQKWVDGIADHIYEMAEQFEYWKAKYGDRETFDVFEQVVKDRINSNIENYNFIVNAVRSGEENYSNRYPIDGRDAAKGEMESIIKELKSSGQAHFRTSTERFEDLEKLSK